MNQFVCNQCSCMEVTDLVYPCLPSLKEEQLCSLCRTGVWHNRFEREFYDPTKHVAINRPNEGLSLG